MILYQNIEEYLDRINIKKKIWIIDQTLFKLWENKIKKFVNNDLFFIMESTEKNKNINTYLKITNFMFENNVDRSFTIFALGGGIIGDTTAFVASTYMRGIKLIQVPTTLLSMVDSSIGGKTGINNIYGKNMIGSIYQAKDIVIDLSWLETLEENQKINGMAEVIKMALIKGGKLYDLIKNSNPDDWNYLEEMIKMSANYKLDIIKEDHKDITGERELLNLGHTWGHALEFSQNLLHGFAVADGIIEEMKYSNYYYGFPSFGIMQEILNLLKKWKLLPDNKSLLLNDISNRYKTKLLNFYLTKDKKSDRLVTIEKIGLAKIVKWNLDDWKFLNCKSFMVKNNKVSFPETIKFSVPSSKSITNRALLCAVIISMKSNEKFIVRNILKSEDTELMIQALRQSNINIEENFNNIIIHPGNIEPKGNYYLGNSGTSVRFLLPILSLLTKNTILIDGSDEMKKRPIGPLVKSLNSFGCNITSKNVINGEEYLPLIIYPSNLNLNKINNIEIDGTLSSQYITGLMLGFSFLKVKNENNEFNINILGENTSKGFIELSEKLMKEFGINCLFSKKKIIIDKINIINNEYLVEGDATTASYLYAWSIINNFKINLENLTEESNQPDMKVLLNILNYFGDFKNNTFVPNLKKLEDNKEEIILDLDSSDTFLTWACLFGIYNKPIEIINIENQNWKECARIDNFIENFNYLEGKTVRTKTGFKILKGINKKLSSQKFIKTYNDHRMAMSFSLFSLINKNILIDNPHCVSKTFPKYWDNLKTIGIDIIPTNKINYKKIILIGMPGSGKTTLAKEAGEKFNIGFTDTDDTIINEHGNIHNIVNKYGWDEFRSLESMQLLNNTGDINNIKIISTGGGIIENHISRNFMESNLIIWIKRDKSKVDISNRKLQDSYDNLEIQRNNIYESMSDYIYYNNGKPDDFVKWLKLVLFQNPISSKSTFLCKSDSNYESNISSCIEIRGDLFEENYGLNVIQETMIKFGKPCIYTLRTKNEGGLFNQSNEDYININKKAIKLGIRFLDIEVNKNVRIKSNIDIIGSIHSNDLNYINNNLENFNNEILKIVSSDNICEKLNLDVSNKIIIDNDTTNYRTNNFFMTPISSSISDQTAPNQLNYKEYLEKSYQNNNKKCLFLFGNNIGESPSSYLHNEVINDKKISYFPLETNNIEEIISIINSNYFIGASITMPFKEVLINKIKNDSKLNAINTIIKSDNEFKFCNTDTLAIKYFLKDLPIFILGTGGAAIGAIEACIDKDVTVVGRSIEKLKILKDKFNKIKTKDINLFSKLDFPHTIINCIPPNISINKYINNNSYLIDMTYGIHIFGLTNNLKNYVSGYDILYVQAAYQYLNWFEDKNEEEIINKYKKAMDKFISHKYNLIR